MKIKSGTGFLVLLLLVAQSILGQVPLQTSPFWQSVEVDVYSTGLIWRDANNDGYIDLFISNGNDIERASNVIYLSEYGQLPTSGSWYSADAEYSGHCGVGDINDDGFADFIVSNYIGNSGFSEPSLVEMYATLGGLPSTISSWHSADSFYTFSCALGDVDNDGDLDLAVATGEGYNNILTPEMVFFNIDGQLSSTPGWTSSVNTAALDVAWGDVDNDGDLDLATCDDVNGVYIYLNNSGTLEASPSWQCDNTGSANTIMFGHVDDDGLLDLIVAFNSQLGGHGKFCAYLNNGTGLVNITPDWESSTGGYGAALALYDYDNDGDNDLTAGRWFDRLRIYENTGGTFSTTPVWQATPSTVAEEVAWIDIDGDGLELFVDILTVDGSRSLFYVSRQPVQFVDSVMSDGMRLTDDEYCYDLFHGWVSLAEAPTGDLKVYYQYSLKKDLTIAHWDTYNMAYANTNAPALNYYADTVFGWVPLEVNFSDSSLGASQHLWHFGDGFDSSDPEPSHTYQTGGSFDVSLEAELSDGYHHRRVKNMVIVLADTLYTVDDEYTGSDSIVIPLYLKNSQPLEKMVLPLYYGGDVNLEYLGFDAVGCRTDYFEEIVETVFAPSQKIVAFRLTASAAGHIRQSLAPGDGAILNLYFRRLSGTGSIGIDTTIAGSRVLDIDADYVSYVPAVRMGNLVYSSLVCGDANGDGSGPDISDLVYLVNYMFNEGPVPPELATVDVDASGSGPDIADLVYLVNYMFSGGPILLCGF